MRLGSAARDRMTTYDLHQHLWPEAFVTALRARTRPPRLVESDLVTDEGTFPVDLHDHDPERRLEALAEHGLDSAVLSLQPSLGLDSLPPEERLRQSGPARTVVRQTDSKPQARPLWKPPGWPRQAV